jgi:hypothetical protein
MKTALNATAALAVCAFLLGGKASAQTETAPAPPPASTMQLPPGIILTPPRAPPPVEQSCPATSTKLDLIV